MTDKERAVIEAAESWLYTRRTFGATSGRTVQCEALLARSIDLMNNERETNKEKSND